MLRKIFRDPLIAAVLIINMALIFFLIINVLNIKYQNDEIIKNKTKYNPLFQEKLIVYTKGCQVDENGEISTGTNYTDEKYEAMLNEIFSIAKKFNGNISFDTDCILNDTEMNNIGGVSCVIKHDEDIMADMTDGNVFLIKAGEKSDGIIVSEVYKDNVKYTDGKGYIYIEGVRFNVIGFEKDYSPDHSLCGAVIYEELLNESDKSIFFHIWDKFLWIDEWRFSFSSNSENASEEFENIKKEFEDRGYAFKKISLGEKKTENKLTYLDVNEAVSGVIYIMIAVFAVINCIFLTNIWMMRKKRELVIRKTFGQRMIKISQRLISEYAVITLFTVCVSIVIQKIYAHFTGEIVLHFSVENMIVIVISMLVLIVVDMFIPLVKVAKLEPVKGLKRV